MAINKNHEFEELNGVKCAIVEKNASQERVDFLKDLLEFNKYTVVIAASAPPKAAPVAPKPVKPAAPVSEGAGSDPLPAPVDQPPIPEPPPPAPPTTYTIGVTDVTFNPINAVFGRQLKTKDGHIVTLAYWHQKEKVAHDEVPYYEKKF